MEMFNIVDKKDKVTGQASRFECHSKGLRHRAVHIFLFNADGQILIQKRSRNKDIFPGYYEASVSGHVRKGESYSEAAVRELQEELGLEKTEKELKEAGKLETKFEKEHHFAKLFITHTHLELSLDYFEVELVKWVSLQELVQMIKSGKKDFTPEFLAAMEFFIKNKK